MSRFGETGVLRPFTGSAFRVQKKERGRSQQILRRNGLESVESLQKKTLPSGQIGRRTGSIPTLKNPRVCKDAGKSDGSFVTPIFTQSKQTKK